MKIKITFLTAFVLFSVQTLFAQSDDLKFEKIMYRDIKLESVEYTVEISNCVSTATEAKFKFKIINKTADFLLFDASKCKFEIAGTSYTPKDKFVIIDPYDTKSKTISIIGTALNKVKSYNFTLAGVQRVIPLSEFKDVPPFKLPASKNDFSVEKFNIQLVNSRKESGATFVKFDVQYRGDKIGFIYPSKIDVLMPDGNNYANADSKGKTFLMFPGDSEKFSANWSKMPGGRENDMQMVEMLVNFNGVFAEGEARDLDVKTIEIIWDEALTIASK